MLVQPRLNVLRALRGCRLSLRGVCLHGIRPVLVAQRRGFPRHRLVLALAAGRRLRGLGALLLERRERLSDRGRERNALRGRARPAALVARLLAHGRGELCPARAGGFALRLHRLGNLKEVAAVRDGVHGQHHDVEEVLEARVLRDAVQVVQRGGGKVLQQPKVAEQEEMAVALAAAVCAHVAELKDELDDRVRAARRHPRVREQPAKVVCREPWCYLGVRVGDTVVHKHLVRQAAVGQRAGRDFCQTHIGRQQLLRVLVGVGLGGCRQPLRDAFVRTLRWRAVALHFVYGFALHLSRVVRCLCQLNTSNPISF